MIRRTNKNKKIQMNVATTVLLRRRKVILKKTGCCKDERGSNVLFLTAPTKTIQFLRRMV